jgi:hypothetical protein
VCVCAIKNGGSVKGPLWRQNEAEMFVYAPPQPPVDATFVQDIASSSSFLDCSFGVGQVLVDTSRDLSDYPMTYNGPSDRATVGQCPRQFVEATFSSSPVRAKNTCRRPSASVIEEVFKAIDPRQSAEKTWCSGELAWKVGQLQSEPTMSSAEAGPCDRSAAGENGYHLTQPSSDMAASRFEGRSTT